MFVERYVKPAGTYASQKVREVVMSCPSCRFVGRVADVNLYLYRYAATSIYCGCAGSAGSTLE
jgi:hypothetical protein